MILITGGSNGIGLETARILSRSGYDVAVFDIDDDFSDLPDDVNCFHGDVNDPERVHEVINDLDLTTLINCAGFQEQSAVEDTELESFKAHMNANFFGTVNTVQASIPTLRENNGRIINVSSIAGKIAIPFLSGYSASKFAVEGFSDSLRRELDDIEVVLVEPGRIKTGFNLEAKKKLRQHIPESRYTEKYQKRLESPQKGIQPENAGRKLAKIAIRKNVKPRHSIGPDAYILKKLNILIPSILKDAIFRRV